MSRQFTLIETPVQGDLGSVLIYVRWCIRDSLGRDERPLPALGAGTGAEREAERAVFYADRGWTDPMFEALERYLKAGVPVERRFLEDRKEVTASEAAALAAFNLAITRKLGTIFERCGQPYPW